MAALTDTQTHSQTHRQKTRYFRTQTIPIHSVNEMTECKNCGSRNETPLKRAGQQQTVKSVNAPLITSFVLLTMDKCHNSHSTYHRMYV